MQENEAEGSDDDDMGDEEGDDSLMFPAEYALAVAEVLALDPEGAGKAVKDLKMETDEEKLQLALTLWDVGAIRTLA